MRPIVGCLCLLILPGCGSSEKPTEPSSGESREAVRLSIGSDPSSSQDATNHAAGAAEFQTGIQALVDKARQAVVNGQVGIAIEALSQAIGVNPGDSRLLRMRADVYVLAGELANARADFSTAIQTNPENSELYNVRGYFLMANGIAQAALADFDRAIELDPSLAAAWNNRGLVFLAGQDYQKAEQQFQKAVEANETYPDAWNNRGFARMKQNRLEEAISDIRQCLRLKSDYVAAWNNLGLIHMRTEEFEEAARAFGKAIELSPTDARWYGHRRMALLEAEQFDAAGEDERKAKWLNQLAQLTRQAKANVQDAGRWIARGDWLADGNEFGAAIQDYSRSLRLQPDNIAALNARARAWTETGDLKRAISDCDESLVIRPTQEAYSIRGDAWLAMNNLDQAIQDYEAARRFDEELARAYQLRAARHREKGDIDHAEKDQQTARRIRDALEGRLSENLRPAQGADPFPDDFEPKSFSDGD